MATDQSEIVLNRQKTADTIINWINGTDPDGFSPLGRMVVWVKSLIILYGYLGIAMPIISMLLGLVISHAWADGIPIWVHITSLIVFGTSILLGVSGKWQRYPLTTIVLFIIALIDGFMFWSFLSGWYNPIIWAQWIMIGGILLFGVPALVLGGLLADFVTLFIHKLWKFTPKYRIQFLVEQYFNTVMWLFFFSELVIMFGVRTPTYAVGLILLGIVGYVVFFWDARSTAIGKFLVYAFQVCLLIWALGVSLPTSTSLWLTGYDLRHMWGFYRLNALTQAQWELDRVEEALATAEAKQIKTDIDETQKAIGKGNLDDARKRLEKLEKPYKEDPLLPGVWEKTKKGFRDFGDWIDHK